jgi:hypothetical protein
MSDRGASARRRGGPVSAAAGGVNRRVRRPGRAGTSGASGGGDHEIRRRLGREPERREEPAHGAGLGHRPEDPPRAAAARTDQDLELVDVWILAAANED